MAINTETNVDKPVVWKRRPSQVNWDRLRSKRSCCMHSSLYHRMLNEIHPECYIETEKSKGCDAQYGAVVEIIRDKYGIPVCFKVQYMESYDDKIVKGYDYISANEVVLCEPRHDFDPIEAYGFCGSDYQDENAYGEYYHDDIEVE